MENAGDKFLVIFDCDGVLVDSEILASQIFCDLVNARGMEITLDQVLSRFVGRSVRDAVREVGEVIGADAVRDLEAVFEVEVQRRFTSELQAVTGVRDVLCLLRDAQIPVCVASSGSHERIRHSLTVTALKGFFNENIFSAHDVVNGKPAPDLFLHAARQMGFSPDRCMVIEDSHPGVTAALAADMSVFGYVERTPVDRLASLAVSTFSTMHELPALIATLINRPLELNRELPSDRSQRPIGVRP